MNLHSILKIDKSFKLCYLKKSEFLFNRGDFFMDRFIVLLLVCMVFAGGCRRYNPDELPEVEPLPGEQPARIKLNVNIDDNSSAQQKSTPKKKQSKPEKKNKQAAIKPGQAILSPNTRHKMEKRQPRRRSREIVPTSVGIIDGELNSVEQSYLREVRARREQQVRTSEQQVFGSFSPGNIFKAPAD